MGARRTAGLLVPVLVSVLGLTAGLTACSSRPPAPADTPVSAAASGTPDAGAVAALARLHAWLDKPGTADMQMSTVQTSSSDNPVGTLVLMSGTTDVANSMVQMTGQQRTFGGPNALAQVDTVAADGLFYTTVPPKADSGSQSGNSPTLWTSTPLSSVRGIDSAHSVWWLALESLAKVLREGASTTENLKSVTEYTGTVNLAVVPGIPSSMLKLPFFKQVGTTEVSVDLYTDVSTGALVQVTYRMGLNVSVDATPVGQSLAGFEVDLSSLGSATPLTPPVAVPAEKYIIPDGNDDLCRLMIF